MVSKNTPLEKTFKPNSGKEKFPFKREEILSWLVKVDLPAKGQPDERKKEEGDGTERMGDRERRGRRCRS